MKKYKLEIACFNAASATIAAENGADRIEFCDNFKAGGTTPDLEITQKIMANVPILVMIRPRGGTFVYTEAEFEKMKASIIGFKKIGIHGFVFGILNEDDTVNVLQNKLLVSLAHPLPCTFHRAFDRVHEPFEALEAVIACGFSTILTSGQHKTAVSGIAQLQKIIEKAKDRIAILPGGGVRSTNIAQLKKALDTEYYHSSAILNGTEIADKHEIVALKQEIKS
jgi:copper homeostasis protein